MTDTIFAHSSGSPPAAIGVIRISGPQAAASLRSLCGDLPPPRRASLRTWRAAGEVLDRGLVLWLPGPGTATGEDLAELHCHGGRAVLAAMDAALAAIPGLRRAEPGEFTRRSFANGRIDLAEAEGLADLLSAETELQRRNALSLAGGALSRVVERWRETLLAVSAQVEATLDFADEYDVAPLPPQVAHDAQALARELLTWLDRPHAELLRDGVRVVLAGPPNAGKSTLFNALVNSDAAIVTPIAGTTRDVLARPVALSGIPFVFVDTAGLHEKSEDEVERIGIARARGELDRADIVLWLGEEGQGPTSAWEITALSDRPDHRRKRDPRHVLSAMTGQGMDELREDLVQAARTLLPQSGEAVLHARQRACLAEAHAALSDLAELSDLLIIAEQLRLARVAFDRLLGRTTTEDVLDAVFGRFCIGK